MAKEKKTTSHSSKKLAMPIAYASLSVMFIAGLFLFAQPPKANAQEITVYKTPTCGCCSGWVEHLEDNGFTVTTHNVGGNDLNLLKSKHGISPQLMSCHTALIEGYVVEGHVPASSIKRLLTERPEVKGIAVPGMPMGSPGMEGDRRDRYDVLTFDDQGETTVFDTHE